MQKIKYIAYNDWTEAISKGLLVSMQLTRQASGKWKCMSRILDPEHGEQLYTVATYRRKQAKLLRNAGAWLKVYEDYNGSEKISFFISVKETK